MRLHTTYESIHVFKQYICKYCASSPQMMCYFGNESTNLKHGQVHRINSKPLSFNCSTYFISSQLYFPARESFGGTRLLRRADMNIGCHINTFVRVRCKLTDPGSDGQVTGAVERRHVVFMGKTFGSLHLINRSKMSKNL